MPRENPGSKNNHVKSDLLRWLLIGIGWSSIVAGILGLFLPLVPSVPFLLLAAVCFSRSSEKFHRWLVEHKQLGPMLQDYLTLGSVPLKAKLTALAMVWISFPTSAFLFVSAPWLKISLLVLATAITLYLLYLPTSAPVEKGKETSEP